MFQVKSCNNLLLYHFQSSYIAQKIWLGLTGAQSEVAVKSLEYFTDLDEERFSGDGTIPQRGNTMSSV